jgi:hypothetical protein
VSLKDAEDRVESVLVYTVASSGTNCLPWPTGRGNLLRNAWVKSPGYHRDLSRDCAMTVSVLADAQR